MFQFTLDSALLDILPQRGRRPKSGPGGGVAAAFNRVEKVLTGQRSTTTFGQLDQIALDKGPHGHSNKRQMPNAQVLVLHGSPGSGKTTLARAVTERLRQADLAHALIDLDALSIVYPYQGRSFSRTNLRAVWPNYAAVPDLKVVLPLVVVDHSDLLELKEITETTSFIVCELMAPRGVLESRVINREPNQYWRLRLLDWIAKYHDRDDHAAIRDFQVSTDERTIEESTSEVIDHCGWSGAIRRSV